MNFQYNCFNYTQDGFHQDQGVQHILTNQAAGTYFHGVAPITGPGVINQPVIWPEYHAYQPQKNSRLLGNYTALPQFLPVNEIPVFHPMPAQEFYGMTLQDGVIPFDTQLQGPVMFVDATGQQHDTSAIFHPQLQTMDGAPVSYVQQLHTPIMCVDAHMQKCTTAVPFNPQPQAPFMLVEGGDLPHDTTVPSDPYLQASLVVRDATGLQYVTTVPSDPYLQVPSVTMDVTDLHPGTIMPLNPVPEPIPVQEAVQVLGTPQLPLFHQPVAEPSSTSLMKPAEVVNLPALQRKLESKVPMEIAERAPGCVTTETPKQQLITFMVVAEAKEPQDGQPKARTEPWVPGAKSSKDSLVVNLKSQDDNKKIKQHGALENTVQDNAEPADQSASIKLSLKTASYQAGKADIKLAKKTKDRLPESDNKGKDKRKRKHDKQEKEKKEKRQKKTTKAGNREKKGPDASKKADGSTVTEDQPKAKHKDSKKSKSKKTKVMATPLQPRSKLGERIMHSVQVFHKLGERVEKVKPPKPTQDESAQISRPSSSGGQRVQPRIPFPIQPYSIPKVKRPSNVSDQPRSSNVPDHAPVCFDSQQPQPAPSQSRPSAPAPERKIRRPRTHQRHPYEVPHYYKNHTHGSIGNYGDGERIVYMKPEHPGMFPLPLICLPPLPPGAPRRFHCREYSVTITAERRAEREAMKREAQRKREEAVKTTQSGMNCTVLADRKHLPHEPWPREDNWWETGLDEVWKYDECMEGPRDDLDID